MRRLTTCFATALILAALSPSTASAQSTVNFFLGGFIPRSIDSRDPNDVIVAESTTGGCPSFNPCPLASANQNSGIDMSEFNNITVGGEWVFGLGRKFEGGLGIGYYSKSVPTVYAFQTYSDGTDIPQSLRLRVIPFTATVRWLPIGRDAGFIPYIGAGVGVFSWKYTEQGYFILPSDPTTVIDASTNPYEASGSATGPVILGGVRVPIGAWAVGGEIRYQNAKGDLPTTGNNAFIAPKIDLTGFNYLFTIGFKFF